MVIRAITLAQYRNLVASLPKPTETQMQAFAKFVCNAHSWYKHLPILPPGKPFQFYLDPAAGMQLTVNANEIAAVPRNERGFHYSWLPTAEYRERFGYLAYSQSYETAVSLVSPNGNRKIGSDHSTTVFDPNTGHEVSLPQEIIAAGQTFVSGIVHDYGLTYLPWHLEVYKDKEIQWPEPSGGQHTLAAIMNRYESLRNDPSEFQPLSLDEIGGYRDVDAEIYRLTSPERQRQIQGMIDAMTRVADLIDFA